MLPTMPMKHVNVPCITPASSSVPAITPPVQLLIPRRLVPWTMQRGSNVNKDYIGAIVVPDAGNGGGRNEPRRTRCRNEPTAHVGSHRRRLGGQAGAHQHCHQFRPFPTNRGL